MTTEAKIQITAQTSGSADVAALRQEISALKSAGVDSAGGMDKLNLSTVGARREIVVLAHELATGNFKRAAGSVMVLGERMDAMGAIFSTTGALVGATAAVVGTFAAALILGAEESRKFADAIAVTGGYAGVTEGQFNAMAAAIAQSTTGRLGPARDALMQLASTGQFSGKTMQMLATAAVEFADRSGQSSEEIIGQFAKMGDGVAKFAEDWNKTHHDITTAQYEYIRSLEESGQKEQAMFELAKDLYQDALGVKATQNLGLLASAWRAVTTEISKAWDAMKNVGRSSTVDDQISSLKSQIAAAQNTGGHRDSGGGFMTTGRSGPSIEQMQTELQLLEKHRVLLQDNAAAATAAGEAQQKGIAASNFVKNLEEQRHTLGGLNKELAEYRRSIQEISAAGGKVPSAQDQAADEASIRQKWAPKTPKATTEAQNQLSSLGDDDAKVKEQIAAFDQLGKATSQTDAASMEYMLTLGKLKDVGLQSVMGQKLMAAAYQLTADKATLADKETAASLDKEVNKYAEEAAAIGATDEQRRTAVVTLQLEQQHVQQGTALWNEYFQKLTAGAAAVEKAQITKDIADFAKENQNAVAALNQETTEIGKSAVEIQVMNAQREIWLKYQEDVKKATDDGKASLIASMQADQARIAVAIEGNAQIANSWTSGVQTSVAKALDDMNNRAQASATIFQDVTKTMDDAWSQFTTKGKLDADTLFSGIIADIEKMAFQMLVEKPIMQEFQSLLGAGSGSDPSGLLASYGVGSASSSGGLSGMWGSISSFFGFADGGIMGPSGAVSLRKYSTGGVASSPQLAMFGEGDQNEAYVPLPDGRSIPVTMQGGSQPQSSSVIVNVNNNASGTTATTQDRTTNGVRQIDILVQQVEAGMTRNISRGTGLAPALERQYGLNRSIGAQR